MWTHLERQAGGRVRGMGEKQIEVDKRILRTRMGQLRRNLEDVRTHRKQYRERRAEVRLFTHPLTHPLTPPLTHYSRTRICPSHSVSLCNHASN